MSVQVAKTSQRGQMPLAVGDPRTVGLCEAMRVIARAVYALEGYVLGF